MCLSDNFPKNKQKGKLGNALLAMTTRISLPKNHINFLVFCNSFCYFIQNIFFISTNFNTSKKHIFLLLKISREKVVKNSLITNYYHCKDQCMYSSLID